MVFQIEAMAMAADWFCLLMGTELGPFSSAQLLDMARQHRISPEDLVKRGITGEYVPAYRVKGLFAADQPTSPAPAKPAAQVAAASPERPVVAEDGHRPARPGDDWFCISDGEKFGPMSFEMLRQRAAGGKLHRTDRVWSSRAPKWSLAEKVQGLSFSE